MTKWCGCRQEAEPEPLQVSQKARPDGVVARRRPLSFETLQESAVLTEFVVCHLVAGNRGARLAGVYGDGVSESAHVQSAERKSARSHVAWQRATGAVRRSRDSG